MALLRKMTYNLGHPVSLRHSVQVFILHAPPPPSRLVPRGEEGGKGKGRAWFSIELYKAVAVVLALVPAPIACICI